MTERNESSVLRAENEFLRKSMKEIGDRLEYMFATTDGKFYPPGVYNESAREPNALAFG